jgi:hypothetical protein
MRGWNARHASAMLTPHPATAFKAISRRRDGLNAFFQELPLADRLGHAHLSIHLLETPVLFGHILHLCDQRRVHATKLCPPFIKTGAAHPMFAAQLRNRHTALRLFQNAPSWQIAVQSPAGQCMICASLNRAVFIKNLLRYLAEKILLLNTTNFRGGLPLRRSVSVGSDQFFQPIDIGTGFRSKLHECTIQGI